MLHFWNLAEILNVTKKRVTFISFVFPKLWTPKTWLDKWIKSPFSEELLERNMTVVPKRYWNLHHGTFIIFIDHCEVNWNWKGLFYLHANSWDCLLTHWLPMKSILLLIDTIWGYQFRFNSLRKKNIFLSFLLHFRHLDYILNISKKEMTLTAFVFPILRNPRTYSGKCLKRPVSENPSTTSNIVNVPKHC